VHIPWDDLHILLMVAETGSLSAAAMKLGVTQPTITRRIAALEERVGEPLVVRKATGATLTAFGERLLEPLRRMAECATDVERAMGGSEQILRGDVRITAPPGVAYEFLAPFAAWLRPELPEVRLVVSSTIAYLDLTRGEADIALRLAPPKQSDVVILGSLEVQVSAYGSEAYAKSLPKKPKLEDIRWVGWASPFEALPANQDLARLIPGYQPAFASDDYVVQLRAAEAGLGALLIGFAKHRFQKPSLTKLPVPLPPLTRTLYLLSTRRALAVPRIRAVADALTKELRLVRGKPE
jgi:DNA-binding transcriptional LysR family regulator